MREGFIVFLTDNKLKMLKERYGDKEVFALPVEITILYIDLIEISQIKSVELIENILHDFQLTTEMGKKIEPVLGFVLRVEGADQPGHLRVRYQMADSEKFVDLGELPVKDKIISLPLTMAVISYVREDQEKVMSISKHINGSGVITWLDEDMILPGGNWQLKIEQAIEKTDYFLLFFSCQAANHIGHYNRQIEQALYEQSLRPVGKRFIIPIQLDECDVPFNLKKWLSRNSRGNGSKLMLSSC